MQKPHSFRINECGMIIKILGWQMGFEPTTLGITIRCSNQLSYNHQKLNIKNGTPDRNRTRNPRLRRSVLYPVELRARTIWRIISNLWSGRWDSNSRPSAPKADALTGLRYAPTEELNYTDYASYRQAAFGLKKAYFV